MPSSKKKEQVKIECRDLTQCLFKMGARTCAQPVAPASENDSEEDISVSELVATTAPSDPSVAKAPPTQRPKSAKAGARSSTDVKPKEKAKSSPVVVPKPSPVAVPQSAPMAVKPGGEAPAVKPAVVPKSGASIKWLTDQKELYNKFYYRARCTPNG